MIPRQKVILACNTCRSRKVKCDGVQPTCRPCARSQRNDCSWSRERSMKHVKSPSQGLMRRPAPASIARDKTSSTGNTRTDSQSTDTPNASGTIDASILGGGAATQFSWQRSPTSAPEATVFANAHTSEPDNVPKDAYAMTGVVGDPSKSVEFYGSSSAGSFMRQINSAIDTRLGRSQTNHPEVGGVDSAYSLRQITGTPSDSNDPFAYTLPPRRLADNLLDAYWDLLWAVFPIHDRAVFEEAYKSVWLGSSSTISESVLYCMINLTFALGSQFSELVQPEQRKETGLVFFRRAKKLFNPLMDETPSLEGVQCLLLMGIYLQSTKDSYQCWMVVGSAIRMGQSLGLHLPCSLRGPRGPRDSEMGRRAWYGCVYLDR